MLLAMVLLPNLLATPNARLVCQSSDLHRAAPSSTKFVSVEEINTDLGAMYLYNRTKLAQVCFVRALQRRLDAGQLPTGSATATTVAPDGSGARPSIFVNATHPGAVNTPQQEQAKDAYGAPGKVGVALVRPFMKDAVKSGCRSALFAATSEDVVREGITGAYIVPDREVTAPGKQAQDEGLGEALWRLSESLFRRVLGEVPY